MKIIQQIVRPHTLYISFHPQFEAKIADRKQSTPCRTSGLNPCSRTPPYSKNRHCCRCLVERYSSGKMCRSLLPRTKSLVHK